MRIAVDAMGGDHAPAEIIKGALDAVRYTDDIHIVLVGQEEIIKKHLPGSFDPQRISLVHCAEVITMDDHPATAYRKKKDASITVASRLVKEGKADAVVSAGSTGAQMVAGIFAIGRLPGIDRPAIGTVFPTLQGPKLLLDAGANADCKPENLVQFAAIGNVYAQRILGIKEPRVALISNGEEPAKGSELVIKTHEVLKTIPGLNFIGNIEGRDILSGKSDVMVCDGFVGNTILKVLEGTAAAIFTLLKEEISRSPRNKIGAFLLKPAFKGLKKRMDYSEYGGAPLLGIKNVSIICHGSSKAPAITNAIYAAVDCLRKDLIGALNQNIESR